MRIDGRGGSRIVPCPACHAPKGEHCKDGSLRGGVVRTQSHVERVGKARAFLEKKDRERRLTGAESDGVRWFRDHVLKWPGSFSLLPESTQEGAVIARRAALNAVDRLIRRRGTR